MGEQVVDGSETPHVAQVAFSLPNLLPELRLFVDALGYQPSGARFLRGEVLERLQQLQQPVCLLWWLSGGSEFFQLELFQYGNPAPRARPPGWRPSDSGYNIVAFDVQNLAAAVICAVEAGSSLRGGPIDIGGGARACLESQAGILVELVEAVDAPSPARFRGIRAAVPDVDRARRFFVDTLGFREEAPADPALEQARELLWGLENAQRRLLVLSAAGGVRLELAEYVRPVGAPFPVDHRLSDVGIMNFAIGYRQPERLQAAYRALVERGYWVSNPPRFDERPEIDVLYTRDEEGFSVELLYCPKDRDAAIGFVTGHTDRAQPIA